MEVAIIVIVVFVVLLFLVIFSIRMCNKYNCLGCCDNDTESLDDLDIAGEDDDPSDTLDDDERMETVEDCVEGDLGDGCHGDLNANLDEVTANVVHGDDDHVTLEIDGEEYVINRLEESLL